MSREEHTPGPWSSDDSEIYAGDVLIAETVPLARDPVAKAGFGVAELANARLIAAAPALLEALRRFRKAYHDAFDEISPASRLHDADDFAADAISQATASSDDHLSASPSGSGSYRGGGE